MMNVFFESRFLDNRPTIIFGSSLGADSTMWRPQMDELSKDWNTVALDMRGHGNSPLNKEPLSIDQLADDVVAVADRLGVDKFSFCGLSIGGAVGQSLGARYGERLHSLVLASTGLTILSEKALQERADRVLSEGMDWIADVSMSRWFTDGFRTHRPDVVSLKMNIMRSMNPKGYADACLALANFNGNLSVSNIKVPTRVIMGACDVATPPSDGKALAAAIEGATYHEIPEASHICNLEQPEVFTNLLRAHIDVRRA